MIFFSWGRLNRDPPNPTPLDPPLKHSCLKPCATLKTIAAFYHHMAFLKIKFIDLKNGWVNITKNCCSETNTKAALCDRSTTILKLFAMMAMWSMRKQKFIVQLSCKISEIVKKKKKKKKKLPTGSHFEFFSRKFVIGYPCVRHYILFYIHGRPVILHFLRLKVNNNKIQNGR